MKQRGKLPATGGKKEADGVAVKGIVDDVPAKEKTDVKLKLVLLLLNFLMLYFSSYGIVS